MVREWCENGTRVVREWYNSGMKVVLEWYESGIYESSVRVVRKRYEISMEHFHSDTRVVYTRVLREWCESGARVVREWF